MISRLKNHPDASRNPAQDAGLSAEDAGRYRHILDNMEEAYFEVDLKGNFRFCNGNVLRDLGYSREELYGMDYKQVMDDESSEKVYAAYHRLFLTGSPIEKIEYSLIRKNREKILVEASVTLLRNGQGKPIGFRSIGRNISGRKQAEEDLLRSERKYRKILDSMEESYFEADLKGNVDFYNHRVLLDLGYSEEEFQGINFRRLMDLTGKF